MDQIADAVGAAITQVFSREALIITGKHVQREGGTGKFKFSPGSNRQTLMNDVSTLMEHVIACCRGVGFSIQIQETAEKGVQLNINGNANPILGRNLIERG